MADYKNIKGFNIQYLDSDPPNPIEGQMWFNSTTQTLKGAEAATIVDATWASGGDLNTARSELAGTGTQTAALAIAGSWSRFCFRSHSLWWRVSSSLCRNSILQWYKLGGSR
jgi:hypothetical protein